MTDLEIPEGLYPMRVVTRMTGLSADTIRAWERRYTVVQPHRTEGNARRYSADQVRRLALLREATERGHAISDVASLGEDRLKELLEGAERTEGPSLGGPFHERLLRSYLEAIEGFDVRRAADILARASVILSPSDTVFRLVVPLLHEVGERWSCSKLSISHEHVVSHQLLGMLATMLRLTSVLPGAPRIVIGTLANHRHEFGSLIGAFIAATRGIDPIYLGSDLPEGELRHAMDQSGAGTLLLSFVRDLADGERDQVKTSLDALTSDYRVWIGCPASHEVTQMGLGARFFHRFEDLDAALTHNP